MGEKREPTADDWDHREWVECEHCFGNGRFEDCFEDTCVCLNPPCLWSACEFCEGAGGWYLDDDE